jgi:hypothetical protein
MCGAGETFLASVQCGTQLCCVSLGDDCGRWGGRCADPTCDPADYPTPSSTCPSHICCSGY